MYRFLKVMDMLIKIGDDVNTMNAKQETPLHHAALKVTTQKSNKSLSLLFFEF